MKKHSVWLWAMLYAVVLAFLYRSTLTYLVARWDGDYGYGFLIPFIVLYLVWDKRKELRELPSRVSPVGLIPVAAGAALFWLGELGGEYLTLYISLWLILAGLCWVHLGWRKLRVISFALIMIPTMFPLPSFLHNKVTVYLQLIASKWGVGMIQAAGMTAYREGNVIDLGFMVLQVVEACSGLRYLFPLIVLGLLLAYFFRASLWKRIVLVLSTVPLAIFSNSLRIAITGVLAELWSPEAAEGFFHGFSGWFIFMFSLAVLLLEMWVLGKIGRREPPRAPEKKVSAEVSERTSLGPVGTPLIPLLALGLLAATAVISHAVEFRERVPIVRPFTMFPMTLGDWYGTRMSMEPKILEQLDLHDYLFADYVNSRGETVNVYVAYYETQRKGESIHSPETCLPGSGWLFREAGATRLPLQGSKDSSMKVNRAFMEKMNTRRLVYFWFPQRGRILTNAYQLKWYVFWDALTLQRTDGALVRLITPVMDADQVSAAEERLHRFTEQFLPVLNEFLPGRDAG